MSRSLASLLLALAIAGCTVSPPAQVVEKTAPEIITYSSMQRWLNLQQDVAGLTTEEVVAELVQVNKPEGADQLFYYGLLNQQLMTYGAWAQARDTFRVLREDKELAEVQRQLVTILQEYNQTRINWYQRQSELLNRNAELQQQLREAEQDKLVLQQKIQALTDLEAVISTRKEQ